MSTPTGIAARSAPAVVVTLRAESLLSSATVTLEASSPAPFGLVPSGTVLDIGQGRLGDAGSWRSEEAGAGRHVLSLEVLDWMTERAVEDDALNGAAERYGISYFPFVSSYVRGHLELDPGSDPRPLLLVLDVPDEVRPIYRQAHVFHDGELAPEPRHAPAGERSRFIFGAPSPAKHVSVDVAVRFGAARLAELVTFPLYYFALSLGGIAVAALAARPSLVVAAVGALWTFMLREWSHAKVPRRRTLLSYGYGVAALVAALWAIIWEAFELPEGAVAGALVLVLLTFLTRARARFDATGELPRAVRRPWRRWVRAS